MRKSYSVIQLSFTNKIFRVIWRVIWLFLFRPTPRLLYGWRRFLLRLFGAKIGSNVIVHSSAKIFAPWNLEMKEYSCLSHNVDCYCVDRILIGRYVTISQNSFLCTASHDYNSKGLPLVTAPINIGDYAWVTAYAYVGPGVSIGIGAVVGACACATRNVDAWTVIAGNPAKLIGTRNSKPFIN